MGDQIVEGRGVATLLEDDGTAVEGVEVTVEAVANDMVLLRRKGRSQVEMLPLNRVTAFQVVTSESGPSSLRQRALNVVDEAKVRRHLLDYHGISLKWINENSPAAALSYHDSLDHGDLGHNHKKALEEAAAVSPTPEAQETAAVDNDPAPVA